MFPDFFNIMFFLTFLLVVGTFAVILIRGISQWNKNNHSPRLTVMAVVTAKRTNVSVHHHSGRNASMCHHTTTTYFATFQVESGDRIELQVSGNEFGLLAEGDRGSLSFQGTRYLGFQRQ